MALSKLENLYRQIILDHSTHPKNFNKKIEATHSLELVNATCGDVITINLKVENDKIVDTSFNGYGCTISKASASLMMDEIINCTLDEAKYKANQFFELVQGKPIVIDLGDSELLASVSKFPARIKCATLCWKCLEQIIDNSN